MAHILYYCIFYIFSYLEPISLAKAVIAYRTNDREVMSFAVGTEVKVFSRGAGKRTDLWGVEVYILSCLISFNLISLS